MHSLVALTRKLSAYSAIEPEERKLLTSSFGHPHVLAPRQEICFETDAGQRAYLIEEGWAFSYKILPNGSRQVIDIAIAGDILGLRLLRLRRCDMVGAMVTTGVLRDLTLGGFEALMRASPRVGAAMQWAASRDDGLVVERLVDIGRRSALQRFAHFLLELWQRLRLVGLGDANGFRCPLSQPVIADTLGLTAIHLNRMLRVLRTEELVTFRDGLVRILNRRKLIELAGFDPTYLDQEPLQIAVRHPVLDVVPNSIEFLKAKSA